jgi:hypothetical protein
MATTTKITTFSHPNRDMMPRRFSDDGNEITLGAIDKPSLAMLAD